MIYEITNPSDKYTLETDNFAAACIATLALGNGAYGLQPKSGGGEEMPILMFSGVDGWLKEKFGKDFSGLLEEIPPAVLADVFDSVVIGNRRDYSRALELIDDPAKKQEWRDKWHDDHRSSMNDIGGRALNLAEGLRRPAKFETDEQVPA